MAGIVNMVYCLRFHSSQTMNYGLLKFLGVNRVNVFAIFFACLLHSY